MKVEPGSDLMAAATGCSVDDNDSEVDVTAGATRDSEVVVEPATCTS